MRRNAVRPRSGALFPARPARAGRGHHRARLAIERARRSSSGGMKRLSPNRWTLLAAACVVLLGGQGAVYGVARRAGAAQAARVGREFRIKAGRTVTLAREGLRLRFVRVTTDSPCPTGVDCGWAGNAEVLVEVSATNRRVSKTLKLNTNA